MDGARPVRSPRGTTLTARSWQTEAPLRMLQNNLDPEVAERPDDLVVYGGTGRAARDWRSFDAMVRTLTTLADDETMLVQSGRPVGVLRTHEWAPRVLIANSNLVGDWATWPEFRRLEHLGLTMYGQMTAGSWIYIGTQGILQGTYETFAAVAAKRFGGTLAGTLTLTGGCGGMGGAQPLAVTLNGGVCLVVDVDETRLRRRVTQRYLDEVADDLDDAVERCLAAKRTSTPLSVGVVGNCRHGVPRAAAPRRGDRHRHRPDVGARPAELPARGRRPRRLARLRRQEARGVHRPRPRLDGQARRGDGRLPGRRGGGVRLRQLDPRRGPPGRLRPRVRLPRVRARLHPAAVLRGQGPVPLGRAVRRPEGHRRHRPRRPRALPGERPPAALDPRRPGQGGVPGAAGPDLLARLRRARRRRAAVQRDGRLRRDQRADRDRPRPPRLRLGRLPVPGDRGDGRRLGRDRRLAAAQRPGQRRPPAPPGCPSTTAAASGSAGRCTPGQVTVADGTPLAAQKLERVLRNDPATGVIRHVDAGYDLAAQVAEERGVRVPMAEG